MSLKGYSMLIYCHRCYTATNSGATLAFAIHIKILKSACMTA